MCVCSRGLNNWRNTQLPRDILSEFCLARGLPEPRWNGTEELIIATKLYRLSDFGMLSACVRACVRACVVWCGVCVFCACGWVCYPVHLILQNLMALLTKMWAQKTSVLPCMSSDSRDWCQSTWRPGHCTTASSQMWSRCSWGERKG